MIQKLREAVLVAEAAQDRQLALIADRVKNEHKTVVLIAGPSSSGKTTFSHRLCIHLKAVGITPYSISLDDYYNDREKTPRDENGDYDFESLYALNIDLLNEQLMHLLNGNEVELPRYDFPTGKSILVTGNKLHLESDNVLVIEGIHGLNPKLTEQISDSAKLKVYIAPMTPSITKDGQEIACTDMRLMRRLVRDFKYRNSTAEQTLMRWGSVRNGERKWIEPFKDNADILFDTAMCFELGMIKHQAEPVLQMVESTSIKYPTAQKLLGYLAAVEPIDIHHLPHTSLLREFVGESSFASDEQKGIEACENVIRYQIIDYDILDTDQRRLVDAARDATNRAYAPYSQFHVGAAILLDNGTIVTGTNQENAAYPSGTCAERTALFYAGSQYPEAKVRKICCVGSDKEGNLLIELCAPCGACRQVILESEYRAGMPIEIILPAGDKVYVFRNGISSLLPFGFTHDSMISNDKN